MKVKSFMKNTWHLLACLMLLVACSDDKVEDETTITLPHLRVLSLWSLRLQKTGT